MSELLAQNISNGLIAHYTMDIDGTDSGPFELDATVHGPTPALDVAGNTFGALLFDGNNDYIELPDDPRLKIQFPLTIAMYINLPLYNFPIEVGFFNNDNTSRNYHGVFFDTTEDGHFTLNYSFGLGCTCPTNVVSRKSTIPISTASWHLVAGVIDENGEIRLFLDCEEVSGDYSGLPVSKDREINYSNATGRIGSTIQRSDLNTFYFHGIMDEFMMWDRALSNEEITNLYLEELSCDDGICSNGLEFWDGCECQQGDPIDIVACDDGDCSNGIEYWNDETCACDTLMQVWGCTDPTASNYNPLADCDDGNCNFGANAVYIPNVFHPDAPAPDNMFLIQGPNIAAIETTIYDRWGNVIYRGTDMNNGWNGKIKGVDAISGNYMYQIKVDFINQTSEVRQGVLQIVR